MKYKYPRTFHVPWSPGVTSDDKMLENMDDFKDIPVVVSIKMDGENTTIGRTYSHSRSLDSGSHLSRDWLKMWIGAFQYMLEDDERICGENLYAQHTIPYDSLKSYFYGYSLWKNEQCLGWKDTINRFSELNIVPVTVVYEGIYDENIIKNLCEETVKNGDEGLVIRYSNSFNYEDFKHRVAKYVRKNHVGTDQHWMYRKIIKNKLASQ